MESASCNPQMVIWKNRWGGLHGISVLQFAKGNLETSLARTPWDKHLAIRRGQTGNIAREDSMGSASYQHLVVRRG